MARARIRGSRKAKKPEPTNTPFGDHIRALREKAHLQQGQVAQQAGIKPHTLWRLESGRHKNAKAATLQALARALGTTVDDLLDFGTESKTAAR